MQRWILKAGLAGGLMTLGIGLGALTGAQAQAGTKRVAVDDFESGLSGWTAIRAEEGVGLGMDERAKLSIATEAQQPKAGKGALVYTYELRPKVFTALMLPREMDLTGMKSLRLSVRCSTPTAVVVSVGERGGANYQGTFYCDAGSWEERVLNLDELTLDERDKDANARLDLDQVTSLAVMDIGSMLVNLVPEIQGTRTLSLDEVSFSAQPAPQTTGPAKDAAGKAIYRVDNFESAVIRWAPLTADVTAGLKITAFDIPLRIDADVPHGGGKGSLQASYTRTQGRLPVLVRDVEKVELGSPTALTLSLKTARDGTFLVGLEEKDGSRYQQMMELKTSDLWKELRYALSSFELAGDSNDENGQLDAGQIKQVSVVDLSGLLGADLGAANTLSIDEVRFNLSD